MKKIGLIILFLVCSLQVFGVEFRDDNFKINAVYDEALWQQVEGEKYRDRLTLKHLNVSATINILAYRFNDTITANGLVQKRIQSVYDGWQLLNQQEISELQSKKKNITEGIRSIYRKSFLDESLTEQHMVAGDICFVMDDTLGIVLNISVDHPDTLLEVKSEFNKIYTSLWFGDEKPSINFVVNNSDEWVMDSQNLSRKRFFNANFRLNEDMTISNKIDVAKGASSTGIKTYNNNNGEYVLNGRNLYFIHPATYETKKLTFNLNDPELILTQNGFYAVQKHPIFRVEKYSNDFNNIGQYEGPERALKVFLVNQNMVVVDPQNIKLLKESGKGWLLEHRFNIHDIVADKDRMVVADNNDVTLKVIDLNKGEILTELNSTSNTKQVFRDLAINQSKLLVILENGDRTITQRIIDLETYEVEDEVTRQYDEFEVSSITNELIIIKYKNNDGVTTLEALDFNTFASVWSVPFDDYSHTVISAQQILSIDKDQNLVSFELKTAHQSQTINVTELVNQNIPTENFKDVTVLGLVPLKNKLLAIIDQESDKNIIYLR
ncbi:hypothetical protein DID73_01425 [Candidatus Marinamargulisbacteria bacterium SCGC AG-343-K17]|nr:hypothetical protein DID73_01425 [Candidatus Marinamargulisbacteria bacterium SCGC AG-343-K17]